MKAFSYERPKTVQEAAQIAAERPNARFIAGGTNLLDLMKLQIETPRTLVDVNRLPLDQVADTGDGGLVGGFFVAMAAQARRGHRGPLGDAHELHREIALDDLVGRDAEVFGHGGLPFGNGRSAIGSRTASIRLPPAYSRSIRMTCGGSATCPSAETFSSAARIAVSLVA